MGAFAKYLAVAAVTDRRIPGLAAMEPQGEFVRTINARQPGEPTPESSWYAAVTSEFEPRGLLGLLDSGQPCELPRELLLRLADGMVDKLMGQANDLVVNTTSMAALDPDYPDMIKDKLEFGCNPQVYHLNYFLQPATANALARWLRLAAPSNITADVPSQPGPRRGKPLFVPPPTALARGMQPPLELPAAVDTDVLDLPIGTTVQDATTLISESTPSYVVLRKLHQGDILLYALSAETVLSAVKERAGAPNIALVDFLGLQESDASDQQLSGLPLKPRVALAGQSPTISRTVVLHGDRVVGVLPEQQRPPSLGDLVDLAAITKSVRSLRAPSSEHRILHRRIVPTFTRVRMLSKAEVKKMASPPEFGFLSATAPRRARPRSSPRAARAKPFEPSKRQQIVSSPPPPANVECQFRAETNEQCTIRKETSVIVTISREKLEQEILRAGAEKAAPVDISQRITLHFIAKKNVEAVPGTQTELEVDPPQPDAPVVRRFRFIPTELGAGEIWVYAWQNQQPLVSLPVRFQIVSAGTAPSVRRTSTAATVAPAAPDNKPVDRLVITEELSGDTVTYYYQFYSDTLQHTWSRRSEKFRRDRGTFVAKLYADIEGLWPTASGISLEERLSLFEQDLQAFGGELLDQLVPAELREVLWENKEKLASVQVFSEEPFIPWEIIHLKPPTGPVPAGRTWFLGELGLVRWLHNSMLPPHELIVRSGRAFYVIPQYADTRYVLPEAQLEKPFLRDEFKGIECPANSANVRSLLRGPAALDLFHFAGHGDAEQADINDSKILLGASPDPESPDGPAAVDALCARIVAQFAQLTDGQQTRPMVVLNACRAGRVGWCLTKIGGFAQAFLTAGAGLFIGAHWSVGDVAARHFTEAFYRNLKAGSTVAESAKAARGVARREYFDPTWLAYTVYGYPHAKLTLRT